ncbi:hypothetical protein SAMN04489867_0987 [Pedococcus dokdonensis]|uniref:DUF4352 domain-containing protein n=1 Tax=Pedococcus dokdonensis TaxID=443156 RepID=A0A1H0NNX6_9MICO|nr:hypothetical protein [Pedococcus dokdonensis]SDO94050.1 hypothetical protein SAMN04489867_0987 [Pedococcus dokdonensis]
MRVPRPTRAQLGAGALVLAALSVGRVVTELLPEGPSPVRAFERTTTVDQSVALRYGDVRVTSVDGGRQLATTTSAMLSPGLWVTAQVDFTPRVDKSGLAYAELRDGEGRVVTGGPRNVLECDVVNPGIPGHCLVAFEVDPAGLVGARLALTSNANDQRGDDMAVVDLGITDAQVAQWKARTTPVELLMPKGTS